MLVHRRATPSIKFAGTHLYTWVERGTVRVKCLAQEHNTMSPARARTRTARSGEERTNHEPAAPRRLLTRQNAGGTAPQEVNVIILLNRYSLFEELQDKMLVPMQLQFNLTLQDDDELIQKPAADDDGRIVNRFLL